MSKKTTIRFSINRLHKDGPWNHEFTTGVDLPKWIPYEDRIKENFEEDGREPSECEAVREKPLKREIKKSPPGALWRGFVEDVSIVDGIEIWWLGS